MKRNLALSVNGEFPDNFIEYLKSALGKENTTVFLPVGVEVIDVKTGVPLVFKVKDPAEAFYENWKDLSLDHETILNAPAGSVFSDSDGDCWFAYGDKVVTQMPDSTEYSVNNGGEFLAEHWYYYKPWKVLAPTAWNSKPVWLEKKLAATASPQAQAENISDEEAQKVIDVPW